MGGRVLAGEDGGPRRHAHDRLGDGPVEPDARLGDAVDDGRAGDLPAVAAEGVVALLVGGDEEDLAAHQARPSRRSRQVLEGVAGGAPDDQRHGRRVGVAGVGDQARVRAEVEHVDRAEVLDDDGGVDPVLEAA